MLELTVAATQMSCEWDRDANVAKAEKLVRSAAAAGARLVLLPELFELLISARIRSPAISPWRNRSRATLCSPG